MNQYLQFAAPEILWGLLALPVILLVLGTWRTPFKGRTRFAIASSMLGAWLFLVLAFALPQQLTTTVTQHWVTRTISTALDDSGSMTRSWPQGSNGSTLLDSFRKELAAFIRTRTHDTVGATVIGDDAVTLGPITQSADVAAKQVEDYKPRTGNTNATPGLHTAVEQFKGTPEKGRVLVIMSDGEDVEMTPEKAKQLTDELVASKARIYMVVNESVIGIMSKKDLVDIVKDAGGKVFVVSNPEELSQAMTTIGDAEASVQEPQSTSVAKDVSEVPAWAAVICLFILAGSLAWGFYSTRPHCPPAPARRKKCGKCGGKSGGGGGIGPY